MQAAIDLFRQNARRARDLSDLVRVLDTQTTGALDLSDILRSVLVMSVSALDHFIHEMVRLGMLEAYRGERVRTMAFLGFQVSLESAIENPSGVAFEERLESQVRDRHGYQSFQLPERIASAMRLISDVELWNEVSRHLDMDRQEVVETLTLIVQRRNKIAHESDVMPDYARQPDYTRQVVYSDVRAPIDELMVNGAIRFIEGVAEAIYGLVSLTDSAASTG